MQLGMVGLGRMGANIVRRLERAGHECVVYDNNADAVATSAADGAIGASSLADLCCEADGAARGVDHGAGRCRRPRRR